MNHLDSFNYFLGEGLKSIVSSIKKFRLNQALLKKYNLEKFEIKLEELVISKPLVQNEQVFPYTCRMTDSTYKTQLSGLFGITIND